MKLKKMFRPKTMNMSPSNERTMMVAIFIQYMCCVPRSVMRRLDWKCASYAAWLFEIAVSNFHVFKKPSRFRELWRR